MRLSIKDDMSPAMEAIFINSAAYLDGVRQEHVLTADEEGGFIEVILMDKEGTPIVNARGEIGMAKKFGNVKIVKLSDKEIAKGVYEDNKRNEEMEKLFNGK